jgi:hypothetical protein
MRKLASVLRFVGVAWPVIVTWLIIASWCDKCGHWEWAGQLATFMVLTFFWSIQKWLIAGGHLDHDWMSEWKNLPGSPKCIRAKPEQSTYVFVEEDSQLVVSWHGRTLWDSRHWKPEESEADDF